MIGTACLRDPRPQAILQGLNDWAVKERIIVRALIGVVAHSPRSVHVQIGSAGHTPAFLRGWNAGPGSLKPLGPTGTAPLGALQVLDDPQIHIALMQSGDYLILGGNEFLDGMHFSRRSCLDDYHDQALPILLPYLLQSGEAPGSSVGDLREDRTPVLREQVAFILRRELL